MSKKDKKAGKHAGNAKKGYVTIQEDVRQEPKPNGAIVGEKANGGLAEPVSAGFAAERPEEAGAAEAVPAEVAEVTEAVEVPEAAEVPAAVEAVEVQEAAAVPEPGEAPEDVEVPATVEVPEAAEVAKAVGASAEPEVPESADEPEPEAPEAAAEAHEPENAEAAAETAEAAEAPEPERTEVLADAPEASDAAEPAEPEMPEEEAEAAAERAESVSAAEDNANAAEGAGDEGAATEAVGDAVDAIDGDADGSAANIVYSAVIDPVYGIGGAAGSDAVVPKTEEPHAVDEGCGEAAEEPIVADGAADADNASVEEAQASGVGDVVESPEGLEGVEDSDIPEAPKDIENPEASEGSESPEGSEGPSRSFSAKKLSMPVAIGIGVAALLVGLLVGAFLLGRMGGSSVAGKTVVGEGGLDSTIAAYTYQGGSGSVTVREVIEQSTSLQAAQDADGNYQLPTADTVLGVVRNKLLVADAERQGISVTDAEVAEYAKNNLGTTDLEAIAASYKMDVDAVNVLLRDSCLLGKLRESVAAAETVEMPEPPEAPKDGGENAATTPSKKYADYIIALVGDEWDASKGTWAKADGPYASNLAGAYEITADGATYEAAAAAYYVAYQLYAQEEASAGTEWTDYVNSILSNATIQLYTLLA